MPVTLGIANIGDIHFRDQSALALYNELRTYCLDILDSNREQLHLVNILGDLCHNKLHFGGVGAYYAATFINDLLDILQGKPLRIIVGTRTHDYHQPLFFRHLQDRNVRVYDRPVVEVMENLAPDQPRDFYALYIPEEYPVDWREYYSQWLAEPEETYYDAIFMHGMMDYCSHSSQIAESEDSIPSSVVWPVKFLQERAVFTMAGHVHTPHIEGNTAYTGSFSRWCHGEEEDKGWRWLEYTLHDDGSSSYEMEHVVNEAAPLYVTVPYSECRHETAEQTVTTIQRYMLEHNIRNLRVSVNVEPTAEVMGELSVLREHFAAGTDYNVSIDRKSWNKKKPSKNVDPQTGGDVLTEEQQRLIEISGSERPIAEKIQQWVRLKRELDVDAKTVNKVIGYSKNRGGN